MIIKLYGTWEIAEEIGVTQGTVTGYINRYGADVPVPFAVFERHGGNQWLWDKAGLDAWVDWYQTHKSSKSKWVPDPWSELVR